MRIYEEITKIQDEYPLLAFFLPLLWIEEEGDSLPNMTVMYELFVGIVGREWLAKASSREVKENLCHLAAHIILRHPYRLAPNLVDGNAWKRATDMEANHLLAQMDKNNFRRISPQNKKWTGYSAEEIYYFLLKEPTNRYNSFGDSHDGWKQMANISLKQIINQSIGARGQEDIIISLGEAMKQMGIASDNPILDLLLDNLKAEDKTQNLCAGVEPLGAEENINNQLSLSFIGSDIIHQGLKLRRGYLPPDTDFLFLWRRQYARIQYPFAPKEVIILLDTSGSITSKLLEIATKLVEILCLQINRFFPHTRIAVIMADAGVQRVWLSTESTEMIQEFLTKVKGRGGTRIIDALLSAVSTYSLDPDLVIIVSDFETTERQIPQMIRSSGIIFPFIGILLEEIYSYQQPYSHQQSDYQHRTYLYQNFRDMVKFLYKVSLEEGEKINICALRGGQQNEG